MTNRGRTITASLFVPVALSFLITSYRKAPDEDLRKAAQTWRFLNPDNLSETTDFEAGAWRLDSVAEDGVVVRRLISDSTVQVFNFRRDGRLRTMEIRKTSVKELPVGMWNTDSDSLFIVGNNGRIAMRYGYVLQGSTLILHGNFMIATEIQKKPSFYLSKYVFD